MRLIAIASLMAGCALAEGRIASACHRRGKNCGSAERRSHVYHERYDAARRAFVAQWRRPVLRKGTNEWNLSSEHSRVSTRRTRTLRPRIFQWMKDSMAGRAPHIDRSESHICMALPSASFIRALLSSMSVPT